MTIRQMLANKSKNFTEATLKTIVIYFHPEPLQSKRSYPIYKLLGDVNNVTLRNIQEIYWENNGFIETEEDIKTEQQIIAEHDQIVFLYPVYWSSMPALGLHYIQNVFAPGFAYSTRLDLCKLKGKQLILACTTGAITRFCEDFIYGNPERTCYPFQSLCYTTGMKFMGVMCLYADSAVKPFVLRLIGLLTE